MHIMHNINTYQHNMRFLIMPILTKKYASGDHRVTNDLFLLNGSLQWKHFWEWGITGGSQYWKL